MRIRRIAKWGFVVLGVLAAAAIVMYVQASRTPGGYHPPSLSERQRDDEAQIFVNSKLISDFHNKAQADAPFDWTITQDDANSALASMDEIAFRLGSPVQNAAQRALNRLGLEKPMVLFKPGRLELMIRSRDLNKVLSTEITMESAGDNRLQVRLQNAAVGRLPIPYSLIRQRLDVLHADVQRLSRNAPATGPRGHGSPLRSEDMAKVLTMIVAAIDNQPISTEFKYLGRYPVRIDRVTFEEGSLTLHVLPINRNEGAEAIEDPGSESSSDPAPDGAAHSAPAEAARGN